jgi:hypothetical protein
MSVRVAILVLLLAGCGGKMVHINQKGEMQ